MQQCIPTTLDVALIEGYDGINLETSLGKPFLRKEIEIKKREYVMAQARAGGAAQTSDANGRGGGVRGGNNVNSGVSGDRVGGGRGGSNANSCVGSGGTEGGSV